MSPGPEEARVKKKKKKTLRVGEAMEEGEERERENKKENVRKK